MLKAFVSLLVICFTAFSCASQGDGQQSSATIKPGKYKASINAAGKDNEVRGYSRVTNVHFTFESDQTFIYSVRAMGNSQDDVGKWEIRGDSLYIFALQKGPDSAFKLNDIGEGQYEIIGPNHFILAPADETMEPAKN